MNQDQKIASLEKRVSELEESLEVLAQIIVGSPYLPSGESITVTTDMENWNNA